MRRSLTALMLWCALFGMPPAAATTDAQPIRIGLTPVFLHDQTGFVNAWRTYLESRLKRPVVFVQRASYREITELLRNGKLDFAWLCGYPFVNNRPYVNLLAVPIYRGRTTYQSYLIVPSSDTRTTMLADLRDKVFAFSDPDSNSGYLVPVHDLHQLGERSGTFFAKTFFTWSHRKVVEAVAAGVAHGGAVDGYVWDTLALQDPQLTARTRIVKASMEFGFPPFVSGKAVPPATAAAMRDALLAMSQDAQGTRLLAKLRLDGFAAGNERMFDDIARMKRAIAGK
jgi:phosphonate transport system substrate-binding protein